MSDTTIVRRVAAVAVLVAGLFTGGVAHADTQERNACLFNASYAAENVDSCEELRPWTIGMGGGGCGGCPEPEPESEAPAEPEIPVVP